MENEKNYVCPYCGKQVTAENVLFWVKVTAQYVDNVRGEFLRRHGVEVKDGNRFNRKYLRPSEENVVGRDNNDFPTMLEDSIANALEPKELERDNKSSSASVYGSFEFEDDYGYGNERTDRSEQERLQKIPYRACPHCHCELPTQFGQLPVHHVAMFGGRAAGKTSYLVNLFQQVSQQLGSNNLGSIRLAKESEDFIRPMIDSYEEKGTTDPTAADDGLLPLVCIFKNSIAESFVIFYDIAGEGTSDPAYMANHQGIANCETLLMMIDPNMFSSGAFYQTWTANHPADGQDYDSAENGEGFDYCRDTLDLFLASAGDLCNEYARNVKNIVCVMTKMDMLLEAEAKYFGSGDIELLSDIGTKHRDAVNMGTIRAVSGNIEKYMEAKYHLRLTDKIKQSFSDGMRVVLLGVSTSTIERNGSSFTFKPQYKAMFPKHRIIEPLLVVLMYFSLVKVRMPDGSVVVYNPDKPVVQAAPQPVKKKGLFGRLFGGK